MDASLAFEAAATPEGIRGARETLDATPLKKVPWGIYLDGQIVSMGSTKRGNEAHADKWRAAFPGRVETTRRSARDEVWGEQSAASRAVAELDAEIASYQASDAAVRSHRAGVAVS